MWKYDVKKGRERDFEEFFGADGEWSAISRHARSYLGSAFLRDQNRPGTYMLIEYWSEMVVYERHRTFKKNAFAALERRRNDLVDASEPAGVFTALNVPDRTGPTWSQQLGQKPKRTGRTSGSA